MTHDLATAVARLTEVLAAENAALTALDLPRAGAMLTEKTRAADAFVVAERVSRGTSSATGAAAPAHLRTLVVENQRLLQHAITVQGRVIGTIAREIGKAHV